MSIPYRPIAALALVLLSGCATQPPPEPAKPSGLTIACRANAAGSAAPAAVFLSSQMTTRVTARILYPNGQIRHVGVGPGESVELLALAPEQLPCTHPLKLLSWGLG